jgi:hypothetical protein
MKHCLLTICAVCGLLSLAPGQAKADDSTILAGLNIIPGIGTIGLGADITGASIGDTNTGITNTTRTGGMMMTNTHVLGLHPRGYPESRHSEYCWRRFLSPSSPATFARETAKRRRAPLNAVSYCKYSMISRLNFSGFSMNMKCRPPSASSNSSNCEPLI